MTGSDEAFNVGYLDAAVYQAMLPPHYYHGTDDVGLVRQLLDRELGPPPATPSRRVLDLGCGAGRVTTVLVPYAGELLGTDKSHGMIEAFRCTFPRAEVRRGDTETVVRALHEQRPRTFDLIGSFWSMSYPLLECFEDTTAHGVVTTTDPATATTRARTLIRRLVELLAPDGHLVMLFFDAHTPEQRLVTRLWERIAPFPGTGRDHTWNLLRTGLHDAEADGLGQLTTTRLPGVAVAATARAAHDWFRLGHLNALPQLLKDPQVRAELDAFITQHQQPNGRILIPSGVNIVDFHASTDRTPHLPVTVR